MRARSAARGLLRRFDPVAQVVGRVELSGRPASAPGWTSAATAPARPSADASGGA